MIYACRYENDSIIPSVQILNISLLKQTDKSVKIWDICYKDKNRNFNIYMLKNSNVYFISFEK